MAISIESESKVEVLGLRDFLKAMRTLDEGDKITKDIAELNYFVGGMVYNEAFARANALGGSAAKSARDGLLKLSKSPREIAIRLGSNDTRKGFALGAEYGSLRYRQFKTWRGNQHISWDSGVGYFLQPAIRAKSDEVTRTYSDGLTKLLSEAFPD